MAKIKQFDPETNDVLLQLGDKEVKGNMEEHPPVNGFGPMVWFTDTEGTKKLRLKLPAKAEGPAAGQECSIVDDVQIEKHG